MEDQERHRIADRLRGGPAQVLANLVVELRSLLQVRGDTLGDLRPALENVLQEAEGGLQELREIIEDLGAPLLFRELGFLPWLHDFAHRSAQTAGLDVSVDVPPDLPRMHPEVEGVLLRIVQEAVRNVVKHARATEVAVRLREEDEDLILEIEDNGQGVDLERVSRMYTDLQPKATFGLAMMKQWAARVNGELSVHRRPGGGTVVRLLVPSPWQKAGEHEQKEG